MRRRTLLFAAGGIAAALWLRPRERGGGYNTYFAALNRGLREAGIDTPAMVIDLDILDRNIDHLARSIGRDPAKTYRIVAKSLPSPQLVDYVARRAGTEALMVFHRPFLQQMAALRPQADMLLGKPMPVAAARRFYEDFGRQPIAGFAPATQLQWLIDSKVRLQQYLELAQARGIRLRINLELDVGLRRGGFEADDGLVEALTMIADNPVQLELAGFMGYDAHLGSLPTLLVEPEFERVKQRYGDCIAMLQSNFPALARPGLCFNGAGSPTFRRYEGGGLLNDIAAGSCLLKPGQFDLAGLEAFEPAAFIASPVLKRLPGARLPTLEWAGPLLRAWDRNQAQMYFGYGGNWLAEVLSPPGMVPHFAYGSSNQQGYSASPSVNLAEDDFIFLRPSQSEAVLLQFGDLLLVRGGQIVDRWPVLSQST